MYIQNLQPAPNSRFNEKRLGRGIGSGLGKTSGKGHKGQNARSGGGVRPGFEGGQLPLVRKMKIRGFNNANFDKEYAVVNVGDLEKFDANTEITQELLYENRVIGKIMPYGLKVLGNGELSKSLVVKANKFSASAKEKIEKVGGKAEVI
ncbi:MAG: 50S ribosomal protein L15 [Christensenellales bacterium]|nr:50S ribosomal protein L15 [Bacillota bacterium]MDY3659061.1 50S ribosomal protein L15 [Eubacteriales bacterium]